MYLTELLRVIPFVAMLAAGGYGYHWFVLQGKDLDIKELRQEVAQLQQELAAYKLAAQTHQDTIAQLEQSLQKQKEAVQTLSIYNADLIKERDNYVSVFRRHNLTQLSLARPGRIETVLNNGTKEVFEALENDTKTDEIVTPAFADTPNQ
jgi:cell division septum initiation protein DivIVA